MPLRTAIGSHGASGSAGLRSAKTSTRPRSSSKVDSIKSNMTSPVPPSTSLPPTLRDDEQITSIQLTESRTPSPDLPNLDVPITPLPPSKKAKGKAKECMNVLGMETPREIANSDQGGNRKVGFVGDDDDGFETAKHPSAAGSGSGSDSGGNGSEDEDAEEAKIEMTVQISPRRPIPKSIWTAVPSPLRHSGTPFNSPHAGPSNGPAHDLLHSLIRDALYDFRKETKAEIIGLHLDLVRMGRGWKKEMKDAMEQWGTELKEVREENKRLKEENERLRRGY